MAYEILISSSSLGVLLVSVPKNNGTVQACTDSISRLISSFKYLGAYGCV